MIYSGFCSVPFFLIRQRDAGRWARGIPHSTVAKEFIEGGVGWSSFDARETTSKMIYFGRIKRMDPTRWPNRICTHDFREDEHESEISRET